MKSIFKILSMATLVVVFLVGCRTSAVYNVENNPVMEEKLTEKQMYKAIYAAGTTLGWNIKQVKPGLAMGQLNLRDHVAKVEIPYSTKEYSIIYKNSVNLKYNKEKGIIHSNYNGWIQNLEKGINTQLKLQAM